MNKVEERRKKIRGKYSERRQKEYNREKRKMIMKRIVSIVNRIGGLDRSDS